MIWMLPLETLPGWPEAPVWSLGHLLLIILVLPVLTAVVISVLTFTPTWKRLARESNEVSGELVTTEASTTPRRSA